MTKQYSRHPSDPVQMSLLTGKPVQGHACQKCGTPAPFGMKGDVWLCREHWEQTPEQQARIAAVLRATGLTAETIGEIA